MFFSKIVLNNIKHFKNKIINVTTIDKRVSRHIIRYFSQDFKEQELKYTTTGEWLYETPKYTKIGLSQVSIDELSELVYVESNCNEGDIVNQGDELVVVESVKATNAVMAPYDCTIVETNKELENNLEKVNQNPECVETAWFVKVHR